MLNQFSRTELLFGSEAITRLQNAHVAVFGIGGVGGYTVEALARSGVGSFDLIDNDTVALTNLNRQIIATLDTVGQPKVEVMAKRIASINPDAKVNCRQCFFLPENQHEFDFSQYDYVVDAVDTVAAKIAIVLAGKAAGVPVISSMGAGNKVNPAMFEVADIYKTKVDPLARVMRQAMKKNNIKKHKGCLFAGAAAFTYKRGNRKRMSRRNIQTPCAARQQCLHTFGSRTDYCLRSHQGPGRLG